MTLDRKGAGRRWVILVAFGTVVAGCASSPPSPPVDALVAGALQTPPSVAAELAARPLGDLDLAGLAVRNNPDLRAARAKLKVSGAQVFAAGLLPDPQLQLTGDHPISGPDVLNGYGVTVGLDLLAALIQRPAALAKAKAQGEQVRQDLLWQEWTVTAQIRDAARRYVFLDRQAEVVGGALSQATRERDLTAGAVARHDARLDDLSVRQVAVTDARARLDTLLSDRAKALSDVRALAGLGPDQAIRLAGPPPLHDPSQLSAETLFQQAVALRPDLRALQQGYRANEADIRFQRLKSLPIPSLTLSRARDTAGASTVGGGLSLVLPIWNRNRGPIRVGEATRAQLQAEYAARVVSIRSDIAKQVADLRRTAVQRAALEADVARLASEAGVLARAADRHDVSLITYETVRAALLDKRQAELGLRAAQSQGEAALEGLVGMLIWGPGASQ